MVRFRHQNYLVMVRGGGGGGGVLGVWKEEGEVCDEKKVGTLEQK